jgi:hypothetical protein
MLFMVVKQLNTKCTVCIGDKFRNKSYECKYILLLQLILLRLKSFVTFEHT